MADKMTKRRILFSFNVKQQKEQIAIMPCPVCESPEEAWWNEVTGEWECSDCWLK